MGSEFWTPLIELMRGTMLAERTIEPADLEMLQVTDSPAQAAAFIRDVATQKFGLTYQAPIKRRRVLFE
jgi:hypothetical protein